MRLEAPVTEPRLFPSTLKIPCDPKLLINDTDTTVLSAFSLTALERQPKRDLVLPHDLGIPITLLNVDR